MMARVKHILILLGLLISVSQSAHIMSHVFSDHDNAKKELVHINEHKCQLCHIEVNSILPSSTFDYFTWNEVEHTYEQPTNYIYHSIEIYTSPLLLRGPPFLI